LRGNLPALTSFVPIRFLAYVSTVLTLFSNPNEEVKKALAKYDLMNEKGSTAIVLLEKVIELTYYVEIDTSKI
jgi:hypothetical protein